MILKQEDNVYGQHYCKRLTILLDHFVPSTALPPTTTITRSVAAGFGRRGMPPPASNDTGTALGQDGSDWSRDLVTLEVIVPVADASHRPPSVSQVWSSQALPFGRYDEQCVTINGPGMTSTFWPWNWYASRIKGGEPSFQIWAC